MFLIEDYPAFPVAYSGVTFPLAPGAKASRVGFAFDPAMMSIQDMAKEDGQKPIDILRDLQPHIGAHDLYVVWRVLSETYLSLKRYAIGQRLADMDAPYGASGMPIQFGNDVGTGLLIDTYAPDPRHVYVVVRTFTDSIAVVLPDGERFESPALRSALAVLSGLHEAQSIVVVAHPECAMFDEHDGFGYLNRINSLQSAVVELCLGERRTISALDGSEGDIDPGRRPIWISTSATFWRISSFNAALLGRPVERPSCDDDVLISFNGNFACIAHRLGLRCLYDMQPTAKAIRVWVESGAGIPVFVSHTADLDINRKVARLFIPMMMIPGTTIDVDAVRFAESGFLAWMPGIFINAMRRRADVFVPCTMNACDLIDALKRAGVTEMMPWSEKVVIVSNRQGDTAFVRFEDRRG